jgi:hypothetical protein
MKECCWNENCKCIKSMNDKEMIESIFEVAFGDNAINKGYSRKEVISKIREFSDLALNDATKEIDKK